jgi:dienelactone hydrolase
MSLQRVAGSLLVVWGLQSVLLAAPKGPERAAGQDTKVGDQMIAAYFAAETAKLEHGLADVRSAEDWKTRREGLHKQLLEMLGLDPLPPKTDLKATVTGRFERDGIVVEMLHFQSRPRLYVTANLYLPKDPRPAPAVLYVCGHGGVKIKGVSYGNKASYQHHGIWFARHGYVCLVIDTLQLGEIEGIHHGTYREGMWWWLNRGYTPAGVEAWNCVRALDYLQSRKEVDPARIGVTGRSGGGAYSWWIASIDDRIRAAVPVAGITDLRNHVVDGCVEGHCDCMYMVNTYRWDYPTVAAMVAPRALMIANTDRDSIFPLDGVVRTYNETRRIYELVKAGEDVALNITPGPHKDTQDLQVPAFRWMNKYLKKDVQTLIAEAAEKRFQPQELKVFQTLPADQLNTTIQETFVPAAPQARIPASAAEWSGMQDRWQKALREKSFRAWPPDGEPLDIQKAYRVKEKGLSLAAYDFTSQGAVRLRIYLVQGEAAKGRQVTLRVADHDEWLRVLSALPSAASRELPAGTAPKPDAQARAELERLCKDGAVVLLAPRGAGRILWDQTPKKQTQIRRRFMLLGQTLDSTRIWDVRRAIQALRSLEETRASAITLSGRGVMGGLAAYASLFESPVAQLVLEDLAADHRNGPILLNVSRYLEMPHTVAMAAQRCPVRVTGKAADWGYVQAVAAKLGWKPDQAVIEK